MMRVPFCFFLVQFFVLLYMGQYAAAQQQREVAGVLVDSTGMLVSNASIKLFSERDTLSARSDGEGRFLFKGVKSSKFQLSVSHLGYATKQLTTEAKGSERYDLGKITLATRHVELDEISISAPDPVVFKGDTIEFATRHIQLDEGALTEDLMRRLPGMQVDRMGRLTYMGKPIEKVRINGIDFFGGDVPLALKNLPAELINKAQLVDDYGPDAQATGIRSGTPEQVLNLVVDDDNNRGAFANAEAGYGTSRTYTLRGQANYFDKQEQIEAYIGKNSLNRPITGQVAVLDIGTSPGVSTHWGGGFSYGNKWGNLLDAGLLYRYGQSQNDLQSTSRSRLSYGPDREMLTDNSHNEISIAKIHQVSSSNNSMGWMLKPDKHTTVRITPKFSEEKRSSFGTENISEQLWEGGELSTNQYNQATSRTESSDRHLELNVSAVRKLNAKGRNINVSMNVADKDGLSDAERNSHISFLDANGTSTRDSVQAQKILQDNKSTSFRLKAQYVEPLGKKHLLHVAVSRNQWGQQGDRSVFDAARNLLFVDSLSNRSDYRQNENVLGLGFQKKMVKPNDFNYRIGLDWIFLEQAGTLSTYGAYQERATGYLVPSLNVSWTKNPRNQVGVTYAWQVRQPGLEQLNPVADRTSPQVTRIGNPDLNAELIHRSQLMYNGTRKKGNVLRLNMTGTYTQQKITQNNVLVNDPDGLIRREYRYENLGGDYGLDGNFNYSLSLSQQDATMAQLAFGAIGGIARERFFEEGQISEAWQSKVGQSVGFSFMGEKQLFLSATGQYNWIYNRNPNISDMRNLHTFSFNTMASLPLWKGFGVNCYLSKEFNMGYTAPTNMNPFIVNMDLYKELAKKKIRLAASTYDLLNQNIGLRRNMSRNGVTDSRTNALGRYVMLTATMRVGKFGNQVVYNIR